MTRLCRKRQGVKRFNFSDQRLRKLSKRFRVRQQWSGMGHGNKEQGGKNIWRSPKGRSLNLPSLSGCCRFFGAGLTSYSVTADGGQLAFMGFISSRVRETERERERKMVGYWKQNLIYSAQFGFRRTGWWVKRKVNFWTIRSMKDKWSRTDDVTVVMMMYEAKREIWWATDVWKYLICRIVGF